LKHSRTYLDYELYPQFYWPITGMIQKGNNGGLIFVLQHHLKERKIWVMNGQRETMRHLYVYKKNKRRIVVSVYES